MNQGVHLLIGCATNADSQYFAILVWYGGTKGSRRVINELMKSTHFIVTLGAEPAEAYIDVAINSSINAPRFIVYQML